MQDFRNFVTFFALHKCIVIFDNEQVYLQPHATNYKNKEITANPKPQILS